MIKASFILVLLMAITCQATFAQKSYIRFQAGYGIPWATDIREKEEGQMPRSEVMESFTYGKGLKIAAGGGFMLNEQFGLEAMAEYMHGNMFLTHSTSIDDRFTQINVRAKMLKITPALTMSATINKYEITSKFGFTAGVWNRVKNESKTNSQIWETSEYNTLYKGNMPIGLYAALSGGYKISPKTKLFTELAFSTLSYQPKKIVVLKYAYDGEDRTSEMIKERELVKNWESGNNNTAQAVRLPFSSLDVSVGLKYFLGKS